MSEQIVINPVEEMTAAILMHPAVDDCYVLEREVPSGDSMLVAYIVANAPVGNEEIAEAVREGDANRPVPGATIRLAALPLNASGEVDLEVLRATELVDEELLAAADEQFEAVAGTGRAAFIVEAEPVAERPVHLADLLPDWKRSAAPKDDSAAGAAKGAADSGGEVKLSIQTGEPLRTIPPRNLVAMLRRTVDNFGTHGLIYIQEDGREITQSYAELWADAERILGSLRALGAQPQDRFIFQFRNNQDFLPAFWACMLGGFVALPVSIAPTYDQMNATVAKLHSTWLLLNKPRILSNQEMRPSLLDMGERFEFPGLQVEAIEDLRRGEPDHHWHDSDPGDLALMLLTSGSTGKPKAVRQTHGALTNRNAAVSQIAQYSDADVLFNWLPLDHVGGIVMFHMPAIFTGASQIHIPSSLILQDPLKWLDLMDKHRVTTTWAPNFAFGLLNAQAEEIGKRKWDLSRLRYIVNAGESIVARTARRIIELLIPHGLPPTAMIPSWGMSETCGSITFSSRFTLDQTSDSDMFVQVGTPAPEFSYRIANSADEVVPEGVVGGFQVKGPTVTLGYDQNPKANAESFTKDGWFITGDLGRIDNGEVSITGRQKEVIIINGANFYPHELEAVAEEVAGVTRSFTAVCAVREEGMETDGIAVFFHPTTEHDGQVASMIREIRGRMVRNASVNPTYIIPVEKAQIPKTEIGKIQRTQIQQRLLAGEFKQELKRVDVLTESANTIPDWFFERVWHRRKVVAGTDEALGCWLVFCDDAGLGEEISAAVGSRRRVVRVVKGDQFSSAGADRFVIDPANPGHYRQLFDTLGEDTTIARIVHLWTYGESVAADDPMAGVMPLLHLVRELTAVAGSGAIDLDVISSAAQFVHAADGRAVAHAGLPAITRSLTAEEPRLRCRHIDLDAASADARLVIDEVTALGSEPEVAYRDGARYVPRLKRFATEAAEAADGFVEGGIYLVTGGLGGIGVEIARQLMTRYRARILMIGRKAIGEEGSPALASLRALGEVRYDAVDVADAAALEQSVSAAELQWGRPLDGVLHMAAVYHDGVMVRETAETLADAFHAKALGALALEKLLESRKSALFIGFSSVLAFFPGALVGAYAGANRALENLALGLRARGFRAYSVAWSSWRETGMSRGVSTGDALRAKGIREISVEQGWNSLLVGLRHGKPLFMVGLDAANAAIRKVTVGEPCAIHRLSAFYVSADEEARRQLREMEVVDRFGSVVRFSATPMQEIPLTASGAVDRDALINFVRRGGAAPYVEPKTETERQICAVWQDVLNAPHLGAEDNFFMFGGHSLLATRVMSRLCSIFNVDVPLRSLFDSPTVRGLAVKIETLRGERSGLDMTIKRVEDREHLPLSFTQQRLWFLEQWQPGTSVYNVPLVFRVRGGLNEDALQRSLNAVVARHESLRTTFHMNGTQPVQRVHEKAAVNLRMVDARAQGGESKALELIAEETGRPFDLSSDSMLRAIVVRVADEEFLLGIGLHHITADGWSLDILFRELSAFYDAFVSGRELEMEALPIQFGDYAAWQREYLNGDVLDEQLSYWRKQLAGAAPQLKVPTDKPRPATQSFRGAVHAFAFPRELAATVNELCRAEEVTPFIALLTVLQVLMRQYSRQNDISIGSPISNRTNLETEGLIGFFANTLVLRTVFPGDPTFREMLAIARETALGAYAHQHMPFERLVEILKPARAGYNPLFQVNFRVVTAPSEALRFGASTAERVPFDPGISRFDLALELFLTSDRFEGFFEYSTDLFYPETIERLQTHFEQTLRLLAKRPDAPLSSLGLDQLAGLPAERGATVIRKRTAKLSGAAY